MDKKNKQALDEIGYVINSLNLIALSVAGHDDDLSKFLAIKCGKLKSALAALTAPQPEVVTAKELSDLLRRTFSMWSSKDCEDSHEYAVLKQCLQWIGHNKPNGVIIKGDE